MSHPKIMTIAHGGGEFLSVNLSGLKNNYDAVLEILNEAKNLLARPSICRNIGLHVYDTQFTVQFANTLIDWISQATDNIHKIAIIGLSIKGKFIFKRVQKKKLSHIDLMLIFDINKAKDWLVGHIQK